MFLLKHVSLIPSLFTETDRALTLSESCMDRCSAYHTVVHEPDKNICLIRRLESVLITALKIIYLLSFAPYSRLSVWDRHQIDLRVQLPRQL